MHSNMFSARFFSGGLEKSSLQITVKDADSTAHVVNFQWLETEDAENVVRRFHVYLQQALGDRLECDAASKLSTSLKVNRISSSAESSDHDVLTQIIRILHEHGLEELSCSNTGPYLSTSHGFASMATLSHLNLTNCGLLELPPGLLALTALRSLDLSQNKLASIAPGIEQLALLEALRADDNMLASVPGA
jgi:hypothetical protein